MARLALFVVVACLFVSSETFFPSFNARFKADIVLLSFEVNSSLALRCYEGIGDFVVTECAVTPSACFVR